MKGKRMYRTVAALLALTACSSGTLTPAQKTERCIAFAAAVAKAGLPATPDEKTARQVGDSLDALLSRLGTPAIHDPATRVHQQLHDIESARKRGDAAAADAAAAKAVTAVGQVATACDLPLTEFVGKPTTS